MIHLLITFIIFLLIVGLIVWLVNLAPIPPLFKQIIWGIVAVVLIISLLLWIDHGGLSSLDYPERLR
jgi:hypothetical protein